LPAEGRRGVWLRGRLSALLVVSIVWVATFGGAAKAEPAAPAADLAAPDVVNGFRLTSLAVPRSEILEGGPARDAIHSVDAPEFVKPDEATWVRGETPVIGLAVGGLAHCYPVHVMEYHQVVNDLLGETAVALTYDPLTDSAVAYRAAGEAGITQFGVSGLIYLSNFLLYDRASESLWSQMTGRAIAGPRSGQRLQRLRVRVEPMAVWHKRYPQTRVLALPERMRIDYRRSPYSTHWVSETIPFPVPEQDERFHPKELVLGVEVAGRPIAYVASMIEKAGGRIADEIDGHRIRIVYEGATGTFSFEAAEELHVTQAYWFAWKAFHPDTRVWQSGPASSADEGPGS
jgi:hypothetical protein